MWQTFYELSAKVLQSLLKLFIIVLLWVKDPSESFAVKIVQMQSKILCHLWVNIVQGWVLFNAQ